jgi:hypothetical protein
MIESVQPRSGTSPVAGADLAPLGSGYLANPINGHERPIDADDLQYSCIFPLPAPQDCTVASICECHEGGYDGNPVCQSANGEYGYGSIQYFGKAYPGIRHLRVLQGLGEQGIVGSICAAEVADPASFRFGYRPVMASMASTVGRSLVSP